MSATVTTPLRVGHELTEYVSAMTRRELTTRGLNRSTLERQLLLARDDMSPNSAISHLVGLQSQQPIAPFIGLWTRLNGFKREDLVSQLASHTVVKATTMRSTLHMMTAGDYVAFRSTLQPALTSASESISKQRSSAPDVDTLVAISRDFFAEQSRTYAELTKMIQDLYPAADVGPLRYAVRMHLPLVQVPTDAMWCFPGNPKFTLADEWIGQPIPTEDRLGDLIIAYLRSYGPASVKDFETWSGITKTKSAFGSMKDSLTTVTVEKHELFDVPDASYPDEDAPAPVRFLPEYDNLLRAYQTRTRVIADEHKPKVYLPALRLASTVLVDGYVAGVWKIETTKQASTLAVELFSKPTTAQRNELLAEAQSLIEFATPEAATRSVQLS